MAKNKSYGLDVGNIISQNEYLDSYNAESNNDTAPSVIPVPTGNTSADGSPEVEIKWYSDVYPPLPVTDGGLDVIIQDQYSPIIDLKLSTTIDTLTLLANTSIDDTILTVETTGTTPTIAHTLCLKEGSSFYQARPVVVTPITGNQYTLEMDTPLDFGFTTAGGCKLTSTNIAVDGSVTPVTFKVTPGGLTDTNWDITRMMILFGGPGIGAANNAPDDGDFGITSALTKGIVIRNTNGITKNIFNAKTNGDLRVRTFDVSYVDKSKAGIYTVGTRRTFAGTEKNGVTIRLCSATSDEFELIVQDDLTEMTGGQCVVQGHIVE